MTSNFSKGIEVVSGAIIENKEREILLTKAPSWHNKWVIPGGHIEPGETIIAGTLREVTEEVGLTVKPIEIVYSGELIGSKDFNRPAHFIYLNVYCQLEDDQKVVLDNSELTEFIWLTPEEALKLKLAESFEKTVAGFIKYKQQSKL